MTGVDFHVHARDEGEDRENVAHLLQVVEAAGLDAVAAMPNVATPLTNLELCRGYLAQAQAVKSPVQFYVFIGLTPDVDQVKYAVDAWRQEDGIIGLKAYWGESTGSLSIVHEDEQYEVIQALKEVGFDGVKDGHCEKDSLMNDAAFDVQNPQTWSRVCRPDAVEIASFLDIKAMCEDVKADWVFNVTHVSTPQVVGKIKEYQGPLKLACDVTPHHLFMDDSYLLPENGGAENKCNPPLRPKHLQYRLLAHMLAGNIDFVASDHAPHYQEAKASASPPSGIANIWSMPYVKAKFRELGMSEERIHEVTFQNAVDLFGVDVEPKLTPDLERLRSLQKDYHHNPFVGLLEEDPTS